MSKFTFIHLILIILGSAFLKANSVDTSVFSSGFEKIVFMQYLDSGKNNAIELFIACNYLNNEHKVKSEYKQLYDDLIIKKVNSLPVNKKIKTIHQTIHKSYLKKYVYESFFNDIFTNGNYNCVTASALYSLIFNDFGIPYEIRETPNHVYIIADPIHSNIKIETTLDQKGLFNIDEKYKKNYIEYLKENKLISADDFQAATLNELFLKHYFTDNSITQLELSAVQYYNKGIYEFNKMNYVEALKNFEKAKIIYPSNYIRHMYNNSVLNILNEENIKKTYNGKTLAAYLNNNTENVNAQQMSLEYFNVVTDEIVLNRPDIVKFDQFASDFFGSIDDSVNLDEHRLTYNLFKGYYHATIYEYSPAVHHLHEAYKLNPKSIKTKQLILEILHKTVLNKYSANEKINESIHEIEEYYNKFPFLVKERFFDEFIVFCYTYLASDYLYLNDIESCHRYLNKLESILDMQPVNNNLVTYIEEVYDEVTSYYIRKRRYDKAGEVVTNGLIFCPGSEILKRRLKDVNTYKYFMLPAGNTEILKNSNFEPVIVSASDKKTINSNINLFFKQCWSSDKINKDNTLTKIPLKERLIIIFNEDNTVRLIEENNESKGKWTYNPEKCTLRIESDTYGRQENLYMVILELKEDLLKTVVYPEINTSQKEIIHFISCGK